MIQEETLAKVEGYDRVYEEPDGDYIELVESGNNTITVLTKVTAEDLEDDTEKAVESDTEEEAEPEEDDDYDIQVDLGELTISELDEILADNDLTDQELGVLLEAEENGKNRKGAKNAIEERL